MNEDFLMLEARAEALVAAHEKLMSDLIEMRHHHGLTQESVAERMGVSQPTVAAFERYDSNPTLSTIRRYALAVHAAIENRVSDSCVDPKHQFDLIIKQSFAFKSSPIVFTPRKLELWAESWASPRAVLQSHGR